MNCHCGAEGNHVYEVIDNNGCVKKEYYCDKHNPVNSYPRKCLKCGCNIIHNNSYRCYVERIDARQHLCNECAEKYRICQNCGEVFEKTDNWDCCYECRSVKYIKDYFYKPEPKFFGKNTAGTVPYIGVEFEIGGGRKGHLEEYLKEMHSSPYVYCKYDSSIPNYGCETVSYPATFTAHKRIVPWKHIFDRLKELGVQSVDNCGIHFHVNRTYFTQDNIKVADYIVNNFDDLISVVAGRSYNHYCAKRNKRSYMWGCSEYTEHHDAINLGNRHTIEFRFCKSTNDYDNFIEKMKFIHYFCKFVKTVSFRQLLRDPAFFKDAFKNYINENVKVYF